MVTGTGYPLPSFGWKTLDQPEEHSSHGHGASEEFLRHLMRKNLGLLCDQQVMLRLGRRACGDFKETNCFRSRALAATFGDVGRDRQRRPAQLSRDGARVGLRHPRAHAKDVRAECPRHVPDVEPMEVMHPAKLSLVTCDHGSNACSVYRPILPPTADPVLIAIQLTSPFAMHVQ